MYNLVFLANKMGHVNGAAVKCGGHRHIYYSYWSWQGGGYTQLLSKDLMWGVCVLF